jgi:hypothetical protein
MIQDSFDALTDEILVEADSLQDSLDEYNGTDYANRTTAEHIQHIIDNATDLVERYRLDKSKGVHNQWETFQDLNAAYNDLVKADALLSEVIFAAVERETVTMTVTVTETMTEVTTVFETVPPPESESRLVVTGLGIAGLLAGLVIGVLIGRGMGRY